MQAVDYKCNHFGIYELVPPEVYSVRGEQAWSLMDVNLLITLDRLRERYGVAFVVNDWKWGGNYKYSGFRPISYKKCGEYSQHRYGRGADAKPDGIDAEEIRHDILKNPDEKAFELITGLEVGVSWLHIDTRNLVGVKRILIFSP